ncbi:MAG: hypothetical protein GX190_02730 [Mollicutes bacterium]|nr:hypothetical protein [Mollicutes bacterium]
MLSELVVVIVILSILTLIAVH